MKKEARITPKDDIEIYNAVTNENTDKTQVLKWALCGKDYEDLEEQGLIVRLPCKVGDTVWYVSNYYNKIFKGIVKFFNVGKEVDFIYAQYPITEIKVHKSTDIGYSIFFDKAEAEKKLKELKGEE